MTKVESLVQELVEAIREEERGALRERVAKLWSGESFGAAVVRHAKERGVTLPKAGDRLIPSKPNGFSTHGKGQKRSPKAINGIVSELAASIKASPGERMEFHTKKLGLASKDVFLPIQKLREANRIKTKGEKRARRYFPA